MVIIRPVKLTREQAEAIYDAGHDRVVETLVRMAELERQVNQTSQNSHKPPSSDGYRKPAPKSQRKRTGRRSGGQPGHAGSTLVLSEAPEHTTEHWPTQCQACGGELERTHVQGYERRQVVDLPPVAVTVIEHHAMRVGCAICGTVTTAAFPPNVPPGVSYGHGVAALAVYAQVYQVLPLERTVDLLRALTGGKLTLSEGTLVNLVTACAQRVAPLEQQIKAALQVAAVAHFDETGMRVKGKLHWVHVVSTARLTYYAVDAQRGTGSHRRIGILPQFAGIAIHDAYNSYLSWAIQHGLCNAHLVRELTALDESTRQHWPAQLKAVLLDMHEAVKQAKDAGHIALPPRKQTAFEQRYDQLVLTALRVNHKATHPPGTRGRLRASPARNLAERLRDHKDSVVCFLRDFRVPFDNNQAERDLRMLKVKQKVSGCFRSEAGACLFAQVRGYLSTMRKQGHDTLAVLRALFDGQPLPLQLA